MSRDSNKEKSYRQVLIEDSTYAAFGLKNKAEVKEKAEDRREEQLYD